MTKKVQGAFYPLQYQEWIRACQELTPAQKSVLYYIRTLEIQSPLPDGAKIAKDLGLDKATVSRALKALSQKQYIDWQPSKKDKIEQQVRDRLESQLGGLTEVTTLAGRIDLLTNSEIIEVKEASEWKHGMGQVLAYSGFYPEHKKRIHLFAKRGDLKLEYALLQARSICDGLGILVTFEEIE